MAEGGFLIKFDGKEVARCYAVAFDYDEWQYMITRFKTFYVNHYKLSIPKTNPNEAKRGRSQNPGKRAPYIAKGKIKYQGSAKTGGYYYINKGLIIGPKRYERTNS
jgi:hypothetical protein